MKSKKKSEDKNKQGATPPVFCFIDLVKKDKLTKDYKSIKLLSGEYFPGIPKYEFVNVPKNLSICKKGTLILYADDVPKVGKIKRIVKTKKNEYAEVLEEDGYDYRPLLCDPSQIIFLDPNTKLYKLKRKKFA